VSRFIETIEVSTAHELFAWTETHPTIEGAVWPRSWRVGPGDPGEDRFILAVPTPAGMVGFFAAEGADAAIIRASVN